MKIHKIILPLLLACHLLACGQIGNHRHQKLTTMDYKTIGHPVAKAAITALQDGNIKRWLPLFADDAQLFDDGHPRDLKRFSAEAIGHERFTSIDKVVNNGLTVFGQFHSDTWGDFKTYFKFHIDTNGKIYKLEIGQADY